jgi:hypothetical protein
MQNMASKGELRSMLMQQARFREARFLMDDDTSSKGQLVKQAMPARTTVVAHA